MKVVVRRILGQLVLSSGLLAGGCSRPLLSPKDERSQYDRYDRVRADYASQHTEDPYGRKLPNLRERLRPRD